MSKRDEFLDTHQVAEILEVTTQTIYNWLRSDKIPEPQRNPITRRRRWTPQDVERIREAMSERRSGV